MAQLIQTQTKDYIKALLETEEITTYSKAVKDFKSDTDAQKLLTDFQEAQQTYAIFRQGGFDGFKEQEEKVRELQGLVQNNHKIQTLIKAQNTVQNLVGDLAGEISQAINFPFAQPQRGGCCG